MTIFMTWQLLVTLDGIRNSCDVIWRMFFMVTSDDPSGCRKSFTDFARSRSTRGDLSSLATPSPAGLKQSPSHKISNTELRQRNCQHIFMFKVGYRYSLSVGQIQIQLGQLLHPIRYSGGRDPRAAQPPRIRQGWTELLFQPKVSMFHVQVYQSNHFFFSFQLL